MPVRCTGIFFRQAAKSGEGVSVGLFMNPTLRALVVVVSGFVLPAKHLFAAGPLVLHPAGAKLPTTQQGPFVTLGDGAVLCVDADHANVSRDEGKTWIRHPLFKDMTRHKVSNERALLRTKEGVIIAGYMNLTERSTAPGYKWGGSKEEFEQWVLPIYISRSTDEGKTWEEPQKLSHPWCGCVHSLIQTRSGRIVLVGQTVIPEWRHATVMFVSDDQGKTWQRSNVLDIGKGRHDHAGSCEATITERKDGSLYLLLRTEEGWLYESVSSDGGLQWQALRQSAVKSVTCCAQLTRLADGRLSLLWNAPPRHAPASAGSREELALALSDDDGKNWSAPVVVAASYGTGGRVSYPYLYERKPGELWITSMQGGLRMRLNMADLDKGKIPVFTPPPPAVPKPGGIIMFGDSTTAERAKVSKVYAQRIQEKLEGVASNLAVFNAGISGNTTRAAKARFEKDVLAYRPRVVVMQFGINDAAVDVWKTPAATVPRVSQEEYLQNLRQMVTQAKSAGIQVILMTPNPLRWTERLKELYGKPPYDATAEAGFEAAVLAGYKQGLRALAKELAVPLVDVDAAYAERKSAAEELLLDGMHPNDKGHALVADKLMPVLRASLLASSAKR